MKKIKSIIHDYIILTAGAFLLVIGNYFFKFPNHYNFGGVTGISDLLSGVLPFSAANITLMLNIGSLILGFIFLGKSFGIKTIYVTSVFSFGLSIAEWLCPMSKPLTNQPMLELFFAILLTGIAAALLFNQNASSGGTDIIALMLKKYCKLETNKALLAADASIVVISFFMYGTTVGLFSTVGWLVKSLIAEYVLSDLNLNKCLTIVCDDANPICEYIEAELNKTATVYHAMGSHTHSDKEVIITVMSPAKAQKLMEHLKVIQPSSFVMVTKSSEIHGKGFMAL